MIRSLALAATLALLPLAAVAQDRKETLADIRAQLGQLGGELSGLRNELMTTGAVARPGGASILERMESLELELMRLTGRTEELEMRVKTLTTDSQNRIDDLDFRVTELEGGDASSSSSSSSPAAPPAASGGTAPAPHGSAPVIIGDKPAGASPARPPVSGSGAKADLDRAREVLGQGDFRTAENLLAAHAETYGTGPLSGEVLYLRGEALEGLGEQHQAAGLFLESFSSYPDGEYAAPSLFRLGRALARLNQLHEGCITLGEVAVRYPTHPAARDAASERAALACP